MVIIGKGQQRKVLEEFKRRHGNIHKLMFDTCTDSIGYLVRSEFESLEDGVIDVAISVSFNFYRHFGFGEGHCPDVIRAKFFLPTDLKYFSIISNLRKGAKGQPAWQGWQKPSRVVEYSEGIGMDKFSQGVKASVALAVSNLQTDVAAMRTDGRLLGSDSYGIRMLEDHLLGDYYELERYIVDKALAVPRYYGGKAVRLHF